MTRIFVVNGSPRMDKGNTGLILSSFLKGLESSGAEVDLFYASKLKISPCNCGHLHCWNRTPGECIHKDRMHEIFPILKKANLLVIATPVYIPLPGDMQNFINRLTPLLDPQIKYINERTRAKFREDVHISKIMLVATGGWWEAENFDTVIRIVRELAEVSGVPYSGSLIRPHSQYMRKAGQLTKEGQEVLRMVKKAAQELVQSGEIRHETLAAIRKPLVTKEEFFENWN